MSKDSDGYDLQFSQFYDLWFGDYLGGDQTVEFLVRRAGEGPILELGIGTGRLALPLAHRGLRVHGLDSSEAMIAQLRAKPGGDRVDVTIGDFSQVQIRGNFSLVYCAAGTFFELLTQEAQVSCFLNVAKHLGAGGAFVLDGLVPEVGLNQRGPDVDLVRHDGDTLILRLRVCNHIIQRYDSHYLVFTEGGIKTVRSRFRYATLAELDLMARMAGLRLRERFGGWSEEPFTPRSSKHVSVYSMEGKPEF